jgi:release factor glutamine methyltransferase
MRKNVADHEPPAALFVPDDDPLLFYKTIADFGKEKLNPDGRIYVETHEDFGEQVKHLFYLKGYRSIQLKKDLQGKTRMAKIIP